MWNLFGKKKKEGEHRTLQLITDKKMPFGYVEAYKSLRTNLDFMAGSMDVHTLVITSTVPEESKSNVAVNLAMTMPKAAKTRPLWTLITAALLPNKRIQSISPAPCTITTPTTS